MAQKIITQLVDDLDGTVLEPGEGETVLFSLDGRGYELDLSEANAAAFQEVFAPYIAAARRVGTNRVDTRRSRATRAGKLDELRAWARENGHVVSDRGRIPEAVKAAYDAR